MRLVVLRIAIGNLLDGVTIETEQHRARIGQDDWRMRGDQELRTCGPSQVVNDLQERELALRRERRFGFVEDEHALLEAVCEQRQERLAMRLRMQRLAAVRLHVRHAFNVSREVVEAFGAQKEALCHLRPPGQPQYLQQWRTVGRRGAMVIAASAFGIEAAALGDCLEERRLAAAVLTDEERDGVVEIEVDAAGEGRNREWIGFGIDLLRQCSNVLKERGPSLHRIRHRSLSTASSQRSSKAPAAGVAQPPMNSGQNGRSQFQTEALLLISFATAS
jgi:hypothetical protein